MLKDVDIVNNFSKSRVCLLKNEAFRLIGNLTFGVNWLKPKRVAA